MKKLLPALLVVVMLLGAVSCHEKPDDPGTDLGTETTEQTPNVPEEKDLAETTVPEPSSSEMPESDTPSSDTNLPEEPKTETESSGTITPPEAPIHLNVTYALHGNSYQMFITIYFLLMFAAFLFAGWYLNGKNFQGYGELLKSTGHTADFFSEFGAPKVLINIGFYGLVLLTYFTLVVTFTDGAGFTGPTLGVILAALTFCSQGQHPANVWPIFIGYALLSPLVMGICFVAGMDIPWTLSTQGYINGAAFATGLCPIAGRYGKRYGVLAGFVAAVICTSTNAMHGGFMLYNGGLTTGITALIMVPCLEYYCKPKR